ncbi:hypothetical protein ACS0TY_024443 [Phlomoides rotata]
MENIRTVKQILRNFELVSGLKVNFNKCSILGLNMKAEEVEQLAGIMECKVGETPFSYLGLQVGFNHHKPPS